MKVVLDGINNILKMAGPHVGYIANLIEECDGMTKIEDLQNHENIDIYKLAYDIIEQFFSDEVSAHSTQSIEHMPCIITAIRIFVTRSLSLSFA